MTMLLLLLLLFLLLLFGAVAGPSWRWGPQRNKEIKKERRPKKDAQRKKGGNPLS